MKVFDKSELKNLYRPPHNSKGEENGQVTIIGGSKLFHGAPILSLKVTSRTVDMVFFATPEKSIGHIAEQIKSKLMSFVWVPWEQVDKYIEKSESVLIGPGFMSFRSESDKRVVEDTRNITKRLLMKFPDKKWVIDAGSLQVMDADWIPKVAIITPNLKEFEMLFKFKVQSSKFKITDQSLKLLKHNARKHNCTIVLKGPETIICSSDQCTIVKGGNAGLTKGGTGDVLAGLTVSLYAKNDAHLAACSASFIEKKAADELYKKVGTNFNADDLADAIPSIIESLQN